VVGTPGEHRKVRVSKKKIEELLDKWQAVLRLRDWDIVVRMVGPKWRKSGDIKIDLEDKKAVLLINSNPKSDNLEELVVHELLHLKLYRLDQMLEDLLTGVFGKRTDSKREFAFGQFMTVLESTVEDLTKACLDCSGSTEPLSFGRLKDEVEDEISGS
jgi:hypothetical protein